MSIPTAFFLAQEDELALVATTGPDLVDLAQRAEPPNRLYVWMSL